MKRYKHISLFLVSVIFLSCGKSESTTKDAEVHDDLIIEITKEQFEKSGLKLGGLEEASFSEQFQVTGMVDVPPENRSTVSSYFDGYVSQTHLLVGDEVQKGDLLVRLKHPDYLKIQQMYVESLSNYEFLMSEFERKRNLFEDQVISQKVFQSTKNDFLQAQAKFKAMEEQLKLMNLNPKAVAEGKLTSEISIYSPIDGKISKLNVSQGKFLAQSDMIMEILDLDHVHLELDVFEKDILKVNQGDTLSFQVPEISEEIYKAYVKVIGAEVTENRSLRIHAHPKREDVDFAVGMYVNAYFDSSTETHLALPETAFSEVDNEMFLLKLESQSADRYQFEKVEVQTGDPQNGIRPILNAAEINTEAQYLTQGAFDILTSGGGGHDH
ncbi:efflux RND transporter periplasmic adaptor subunit [Psychroflexus tropicus]|uniref:efflux RND transporter periplasmic adaptor subunit n=1 Tax=Psychroflexus tropicus TaxID=197345 RepID=UPI00037CA263|nr:efflux RND transporter periplasmic adaptor subunit [Psychroflexus tropicus]